MERLPDIKSVYLRLGVPISWCTRTFSQATSLPTIAGLPGLGRRMVTTKIGDLNCDDAVNVFDIDPFVLRRPMRLGTRQFPSCDYMAADTNQDGDVNVFDIDPFVALLTGNRARLRVARSA